MGVFYVLPQGENDVEYVGHVAEKFTYCTNKYQQAFDFAKEMSEYTGQPHEVVHVDVVAVTPVKKEIFRGINSSDAPVTD